MICGESDFVPHFASTNCCAVMLSACCIFHQGLSSKRSVVLRLRIWSKGVSSAVLQSAGSPWPDHMKGKLEILKGSGLLKRLAVTDTCGGDVYSILHVLSVDDLYTHSLVYALLWNFYSILGFTAHHYFSWNPHTICSQVENLACGPMTPPVMIII